MKILVTGSQGFIGRSVGQVAAGAGHEVLGLSRSAQAFPGWPGAHRCADVVDDDLAEVVGTFAPDAIVHAAGPASVAESFRAPSSTLRASLLGWTNVVDTLRRTGVPARAFLLSSAAVYGQPATLPVCEAEPRRPLSPYGYAKSVCEVVAEEYADCFGIDTVVCRLFSVVGPEQRRLLAWEIYRQVADPTFSEVVLTGSATSSRDYLHVADVSVALLALAQADVAPRVVNIGSGVRHTVRAVVEAVRDAAGSTKPARFLEQSISGDPEHWQADNSVLRALAGDWQPRSLNHALVDCVQSWASH